jgi:IclR family transcriptional regulator, KDG regulon repressor
MFKVKSVSKALRIMDLILANKDETSLGEIAESLKLNESTVSHLVSTLVMHGYLKQRKKLGKYSPGVRFLDIGENLKSDRKSSNGGVAYLIELSRLINESIHLVVWYGSSVLYSKALDYSDEPVKEVPLKWSATPLHCTCVGKLILAGMSDVDLKKYFHNKILERRTSNTIVDLKQMKNNLRSIKAESIAFEFEECMMGINGVAAGIKNTEGENIGAVMVDGPSIRLTRDVLLNLAPSIKNCAVKISLDI